MSFGPDDINTTFIDHLAILPCHAILASPTGNVDPAIWANLYVYWIKTSPGTQRHGASGTRAGKGTQHFTLRAHPRTIPGGTIEVGFPAEPVIDQINTTILLWISRYVTVDNSGA